MMINKKQKLYKIFFLQNMLCNMSEEKELLIDVLAESDELSIFETELVKDFIDFKWDG